ncbi:D-beta-hydroxybutyrate dehydrogenase-like [Glandiceps talaboti]
MIVTLKVALITGGSDPRGIGVAVARRLAQMGCRIVLSGSRNPESVATIRTDLERKYESPVHYIPADLNDLTTIQQLYEDIKKIYSEGVDILINNAGTLNFTPIETFSLAVWEKDIRINLTAPFYLTKLCLPDMKRKGWGRIVNTSSVLGISAAPTVAACAASKHGLNGLTKVVALETLGSGVTCNAVCPSATYTELIINGNKARAEAMGITYEESEKIVLDTFNPSGKYIEANQVGDLIVFLCSPAADQMTGTTLPIDGGLGAR